VFFDLRNQGRRRIKISSPPEKLKGENMKLDIRMVRGDDNFRAIEKLQQDVWGIDDITTVPSHILQASCKYNVAFLAGAFYENRIIGFIFALNSGDGKTHYLHMIGVDPVWQAGKMGISVGKELSKFHRDFALKNSVEFIEWTFDPLLSNNANLNFHKLGVKIVFYEPDAYGEASEVGIYKGMPTDRVLVRWFLKNNFSENNDFQYLDNIQLISNPAEIDGDFFKMEVPFDIQSLKLENMKLACVSRLQSREIFMEAIKRGYNVKDFVCLKDKHRNYYIFSKE
jgi:predicted GNAT superfamily acetyltransferase